MSSFISTQAAAEMTRTFRENLVKVLGVSAPGIICNNETFDKDQVMEILSRPEVTGLRVYYGMDSRMQIHAILVGSTAENADLLPEGDELGYVIEEAQRCPTICPEPSPLNQP